MINKLSTHLAIKTLIDFGAVIDTCTAKQGPELFLKLCWNGQEYVFYGDDSFERAAKMILRSCMDETQEFFENA